VVKQVEGVLAPRFDRYQRAHALWVLERVGKHADDQLREALSTKEPVVCVHALHVLAERKELPEAWRKLVEERLRDKDAHVQRAAAAALGRHPHPRNIKPLLALRPAVPAADTHLLHVVRMALRDQMLHVNDWGLAGDWPPRDADALADVALG